MFFEKFNNFLVDLDKKPVVNEWYMSEFADENIKTLKSYEAFEYLKLFISYMIEKYNSSFEYEIMETLRYLKYQVNSNELFYNDAQKDKIIELYQQEHSKIVIDEIFSRFYDK